MAKPPEVQPRRNRITTNSAAISKTFSLPAPIARGIEEQARKEGHNNQSTVILNAVTAYLNRQNDPRAA